MANLFGNFLDKDNPVKKLEKEIQNTEFKKQSLIAPFHTEMNGAKQKIDNILYQIGKHVYEAHESGENIDAILEARFREIATQKAFIAEKEAKVREFSGRYDEELAILRANLNTTIQSLNQPQAAAPAYAAPSGSAQKGFCGNCGRPYTVGEDVFCMGCGQKLED